jgi:hypothetical protein
MPCTLERVRISCFSSAISDLRTALLSESHEPTQLQIKLYNLLRKRPVWFIKKIGCVVLLMLPFYEPPPESYKFAGILELVTLLGFALEMLVILLVTAKKELKKRIWVIFRCRYLFSHRTYELNFVQAS